MKILNPKQIKSIDQETIKNSNISSLELMEQASKAFVKVFQGFVDVLSPVHIVCGTGNNGGDGLAISRILHEKGFKVFVYVVGELEKCTFDFKANLERCPLSTKQIKGDDLPCFIEGVIIDAIFGIGLNRPVVGLVSEIIKSINKSHLDIYAVDIPSGLFPDQANDITHIIIKANRTISFQIPKVCFFLPHNDQYIGQLHLVDIGLHKKSIAKQKTTSYFTQIEDLPVLPFREKFLYKHKAGTVQILAGSYGKMGAAVLAGKSCMRAGAGLVYMRIPRCGLDIIQIANPEVVVETDRDEKIISEGKIRKEVNVIGFGPSIGTDPRTKTAIAEIIRSTVNPIVIDADGINILSQDKILLEDLPYSSILTPHHGEFRRLVGNWNNDFQMLSLLRDLCKTYRINVVLKGAYSIVCDVNGDIHFNSTGNPGMSTAGSGDVLFGMVCAMLSQGMQPIDALKISVFLHGSSGDIVKSEKGMHSLIATDLIDFLPEAMQLIYV